MRTRNSSLHSEDNQQLKEVYVTTSPHKNYACLEFLFILLAGLTNDGSYYGLSGEG